MFRPYYLDTTGKMHTFPSDQDLKTGLVRAWRHGVRIFDFRYRLRSCYSCGKEYQLLSIGQRPTGFTVNFVADTILGKEEYCF